MPKPAGEMTPCACGCGELTSGTWRRGHWARGEGGYDPAQHGPAETLLPGPDDEIDLGDLDPGGFDEIDVTPAEREWIEAHGGEAARAAANGRPAPGDLPSSRVPKREVPPADLGADEEIPADPAPGPVSEPRGGRGGKRPAAVRVTATVRKDIEGKLGLMLEIPGRVWQARDPYCGGAFVQSIPDIRPAMLELVCQSPDLVAWFTGVGGGFMLWLNLITACQPVLYTIWAHHVAHAIEDAAEGQQAPDAAQYAA